MCTQVLLSGMHTADVRYTATQGKQLLAGLHLANKQSWFAGTHFNLVEALVFTRPGQVDFSIINGNFIVKEGEMLTVDIPVRAIANSS